MYPFIKRVVDVIGSGLGLIVLSPLLVLLSIAVLVDMGRPILFKQIRPGLKGKPFEMIKFRTMRPPGPDENIYLTDEKRITSLGRLLRSTSMDELPELFNVLKGDMSLVGPRPLLMEYLKIYSPQQARRHDVKPGITGWAQVNGRQKISFSKRFEYDVWYVDNMSFYIDIKILFITVFKVFMKEGVDTGQLFEEIDDSGAFLTACTDKVKGDEEL